MPGTVPGRDPPNLGRVFGSHESRDAIDISIADGTLRAHAYMCRESDSRVGGSNIRSTTARTHSMAGRSPDGVQTDTHGRAARGCKERLSALGIDWSTNGVHGESPRNGKKREAQKSDGVHHA